MEDGKEQTIKIVKQMRVDMDQILCRINDNDFLFSKDSGIAEYILAKRKLQESIMWLGQVLKQLGNASPYVNSYDPSNAIVEPTADVFIPAGLNKEISDTCNKSDCCSKQKFNSGSPLGEPLEDQDAHQ